MSVALRRFVPPRRDPAEAVFFAMADWVEAGRELDPAARQAAKALRTGVVSIPA